ncbi:MAG: RHS repeat domain-containing protein, partial [Fimbriimonadaceae bacterium]
VKVESGDSGGTKSIVETQYAPCACSPLGKVWRVSNPYAPGGTPIWTTYSYDAMGRTTALVKPDGSTTTYQYQGNVTTVTDAAGKWKKFTLNAFGNLVKVTEPNPAGGADFETFYAYL